VLGECVPLLQRFREGWVRTGSVLRQQSHQSCRRAIATASGVTIIGYRLVQIVGRPNTNPYLGIIFFMLLSALFVAGLLLIPMGVFLRRRKLQKAGQIPAEFSKVDLNDQIFRHDLDIVLVATIVNLLVVEEAKPKVLSDLGIQ
jgi:hypothetical protein